MLKVFVLVLIISNIFVHAEQNGLNVMIVDEVEHQEHHQSAHDVVENDIEGLDLCSQMKCNVGEQCVFIDEQPACVCLEQCEEPQDERLKICTTSNSTYDSDCHFYREKCWCTKGDKKCSDPDVLKASLDYFGACQYIQTCTDEQKKVFPSRIKIWLDEVLFILNDRKDLDVKKFGHLVELADKMKKDKVEKYWTCGVAFEFCQLDKSHDGIIQVEELRALIAPIKSLENCIQPFLQECDVNQDSKITDTEWATCLDLSDDDLRLLRKVCKP